MKNCYHFWASLKSSDYYWPNLEPVFTLTGQVSTLMGSLRAVFFLRALPNLGLGSTLTAQLFNQLRRLDLG